jgi:hypothetical protein
MEHKDYPDQQLVAGAGNGAAVQWIPIEMMRRLKSSIEGLDDNVDRFNKTIIKQQSVMIELSQESGKQTKAMLRLTRWITGLTWAIAILTLVMVIGFVYQIFFK